MQSVGEESLQAAIENFRKGEESGFNYFFRLHYSAIALFACKITREKEVAEEIAEDAFVTAWERHERFSHPAELKAFLYTATRYKSLNRLREIRKEVTRDNEFQFLSAKEEGTILQQMVEAEIHQQVYQAINILPTQCRRIFQMLYTEGKDFQEIAHELQVSVSTIYNQKARGVKLMRESLGLSVE